jgi:hypothetical protein
MTRRAKRLPRLWCALQGLLPLEACLAAQRAELAWPQGGAEPGTKPEAAGKAHRRRPRGPGPRGACAGAAGGAGWVP